MKKLYLIGAMLLLAMTIYSPASAIPYTLTDTTYFLENGTNAPGDLVDYGWGAVNKLEGSYDYVIWEHQFEFSPPLGTITTAYLEVYLADDEGDWCFRPYTYEFGFLVDESGNWAYGEVDTGTYGYNLDGSFLEDGSFYVGLGSVWGDFWIEKSKLTINYESDQYPGDTSPVPEPATLLLLGTGLVGLAGFGRRKLNK